MINYIVIFGHSNITLFSKNNKTIIETFLTVEEAAKFAHNKAIDDYDYFEKEIYQIIKEVNERDFSIVSPNQNSSIEVHKVYIKE